MPLTFSNLVNESLTPSGAIQYDATEGDIVIKVGTLIGENVTGLNSEKVVEFFSRTLEIARAAQLTYNNNNGTPLPTAQQVTSFAAGTYGAVQTTSGGNQIAIYTQQMSSRIPLNTGDRQDNLGAL
jgi:hypothetical protein